MDSERRAQLEAEVDQGGRAYIRNLIAAEAAVLAGQFNIAKILRAMAHAQRVMAMDAARLLQNGPGDADLLKTILDEVGADKGLEHSARVQAGLRDILERSFASLEQNPDVLESDVAQFLWACSSCGTIVEGERPHACPICGAFGIEFESFGPFYMSTPERLGKLWPAEVIEILAAIPDEVEAVIGAVDEAVLRHKPTPDEWCAAEILGHMLETDKLFAMRVRAVLEKQGADLPRPMPPWKLQEGKGYEAMSVAELLGHLRAARSESLALVRQLTPETWIRHGYLDPGSPKSILDMGTWLANHDRGHLAQVRRLCAMSL